VKCRCARRKSRDVPPLEHRGLERNSEGINIPLDNSRYNDYYPPRDAETHGPKKCADFRNTFGGPGFRQRAPHRGCPGPGCGGAAEIIRSLANAVQCAAYPARRGDGRSCLPRGRLPDDFARPGHYAIARPDGIARIDRPRASRRGPARCENAHHGGRAADSSRIGCARPGTAPPAVASPPGERTAAPVAPPGTGARGSGESMRAGVIF
jgi:hypothetical protein